MNWIDDFSWITNIWIISITSDNFQSSWTYFINSILSLLGMFLDLCPYILIVYTIYLFIKYIYNRINKN